jgi:hypothetical protein
METIKKGSRGALVRKWQLFLRGYFLESEGPDHFVLVNGVFDQTTHDDTETYQSDNGLEIDGVVGNQTWGSAMAHGLPLIETKIGGKSDPTWPPANIKPITAAQRLKLFGEFQFQPAPTKGNPEGIKILGSWQRDNLGRVTIPQLKTAQGAPKSVFFHKAALEQIKNLFQAWENEDLMHLVLSWAGSWNPRFVRGSRTTLSNHAWATAFDINVPWNGLGRQPALVGRKGSVRELVPIANDYGFFWGGHFSKRPDGMHFECAKLIG